MTRAERSAHRVRRLAALVTVYAVVVLVGGIAVGVLFATFRRITLGAPQADGSTSPSTTTFPYLWVGVGVAVGSILVATLLALLAESARLRAHTALGEGGSHRVTAAGAPEASDTAAAGRSAGPPVPVASPAPAPGAASRPRSVRPSSPDGKRVRVLSDDEKAQLAMVLPPWPEDGWYPDPLDASCLRRWNGTQWTGEQQAIALPPR